MKKFPLIAFLTLFLLAINVNAAPGFNIIQSSANATGSAGTTATGSFTVNNTGTENLNIDFTGYTLTLTGGSEELSVSSLSNITNMANGTTQSKTFSVVIPAQKLPGLYTGTLTATSNESSVPAKQITINVNVTPTYSVTASPASEINLGSVSLNSTHNGTFSITNTGNSDITNIYFGFSKSGFNLQADKSNFTFAYNTTETIAFNITVPADYSTGNLTFGSVTLASTELSETLFDIKAEVGGGLIIEDLDVFLTTRPTRRADGILHSDSGNDLDVSDGRKLNFGNANVGPESELRFNFNIENTFTDKDNIDINDITVKVTIGEINDGGDIEEESNEFDLDSDTNQDVNVIIKIPLSVDVGVYNAVIEVQGEDDNGNEHTAQMGLKIDIDKEARDVIVSKASLFPEKIKCSGSSTLTAAIKNIGSRIEEEAGIEILNKELDINFIEQDIELAEGPFDGDDEFTKKLIINIDKNTKAGTYPITVNSYIHESAVWETKTVDLAVEACAQAAEEEQEPQEEEAAVDETLSDETVPVGANEGTGEETTESEEIPVLGPTTTTEVPLTKKPGFWFAVIALNITVIAAVALFVVKAVGKK